MKNLKKILALVLAFACAFTMFAGAAFTDDADFAVDADVVSALVSLGVIDGYGDGSFRPEVTVTRAQMAKMIYVIRTGRSDASAYNNDATTFTDISYHWARGYIKYCQSLGVISGKSATIFDPDATVTTQEAAKMLLVTLGYDAQKAGLVGTTWGQKTTALADENGLLKDVNNGTTAGLPRQYAAQLIYNAINAATVVYRDDAYTKYNYNGAENPTIGEKYMGLMDLDSAILVGVEEDTRGTYTTTVASKNTSGNYVETTFTKVATDYTDLLGQAIKVLAKDTDEVYGIYSTTDNEVVIKTTAGQIDDVTAGALTLEVDDVEYDVAAANIVYTTADPDMITVGDPTLKAGVSITTLGNNTYNTASTVYLVSNDTDEKIDAIVVIPAQVVRVNSVTSSGVTLGGGIGTVKTEDYVAYDGIAKDDYVLYTTAANSSARKDTMVKVETIEGTVDAVKDTTDYLIGGTYYKAGTGVSDTPKAGDSVKAAVYGNRFYSMDINAATSAEDLLVVYSAGRLTDGIASGVEAKVIFADGTKETIVIDKMVNPKDSAEEYSITSDSYIVEASAVGMTATKYGDANYWNTNAGAVLALGALYTYEKDGSNYNLTPVTADNNVGFDAANAPASNGTYTNNAYNQSGNLPLLQGNRIDDSAVIFVVEELSSDADAKVITGASLKGWTSNWGDSAQTLTNTKNGVATVMAGVLYDTAASYGGKTTSYGIVNSDVVSVMASDGKRYNKFSLWNGTEDVPVYTKNIGAAVKGSTISYDEDTMVGDIQVVKNIAVVGANAALLDFDGKYVTITDGTGTGTQNTYEVTSDTEVLFIEKEAAIAGSVEDLSRYLADETSVDGTFVPNAMYKLNANNTDVDMIVVDVRGYLKANEDLTVTTKSNTYVTLTGSEFTLQQNATAANILTDLKDALAVRVSKASDNCSSTKGEVIVVSMDGTETAYSVAGAHKLS